MIIGERMKKFSIFIIAAIFSLTFLNCGKNSENEEPASNKNNGITENAEKGNTGTDQPGSEMNEPENSADMAPNFTLTSTDGKDIQLSDYRGKVVIVDFWATWCPPCRKGIPDLIDIQKEFKNDVVVIGISLDSDTKSDVIPFMKQYGINYPIVYGTNDVVMHYGSINAIPTSFVINKKGKIIDKHVGLVPKSEYINKIKEILS